MSEIQRYIITHLVIELDDGHGDGGDQMIYYSSAPALKNKKNKNKMG